MIILGLAALAAAVVILELRAALLAWKRPMIERLAKGSKVVETACGPIEYSTSGDGPPVLVIHGAMGGYDQGLAISGPLTQGRFKLIAVSRPGYLRTPLSAGRSFEAQADAYAALLDALGVRRLAVIAISAGGASALQFALRHPGRCSAMVLLSAVTRPLPVIEVPSRHLARSVGALADVAGWALDSVLRWRPKPVINLGLPPDEMKELRDPARLANLLTLLGTLFPLSARWEGLLNDRQVRELPDCAMESIRIPALVIHGAEDDVVPLHHAQFAASRIPGAELVVIPGGSHVVTTVRFDRLAPRVTEFLEAHTLEPSDT